MFRVCAMIDWLMQLLGSWSPTWWGVAGGLLVFLVTFIGSLVVVSVVMIKLPPTYFQSSHARDFLPDRHRAVRWAGLFVKNTIGLLLVALGVAMSLPGVPGQGLLTILLGIMLLDFPGKRRLEQRLLSQPRVLQTINRLRRKFDKPPLLLD